MNSVLLDLLQRQQRDGFPDLGGSEVVATIPVSERLVNEAVATLMPLDSVAASSALICSVNGDELSTVW